MADKTSDTINLINVKEVKVTSEDLLNFFNDCEDMGNVLSPEGRGYLLGLISAGKKYTLVDKWDYIYLKNCYDFELKRVTFWDWVFQRRKYM